MTDATDGDEPNRATVRVWSGEPQDSYEEILASDPDEYRMEIVGEDTYYVPHDDHTVLVDVDRIEHHGKYAFEVEAPEPVELHIETSDHYHDTIEGFDQGQSIERGLSFPPDDDRPPFQTELWGAIRMRVETNER